MQGNVTSSSSTTSYTPIGSGRDITERGSPSRQGSGGSVTRRNLKEKDPFDRGNPNGLKTASAPTPTGISTPTGAPTPTGLFQSLEAAKQKMEGEGWMVTAMKRKEGGGYEISGRAAKPLPMKGRVMKTAPNGARVWSSPLMGAKGYEPYAKDYLSKLR